MASIFRRSILLFLPLLGLLTSCSEDFEVGAPYKPVTVVYGLINMNDTAHYVRIQKAFYDENKSALVLAKEDDSSFYPHLSVKLKEIKGGVVIAEDSLTRVNLRDEGYPKDSGTFFQDISYAYKIKRTVTPGNTYRLVIVNTATGDKDSAETPVLTNNFQVREFNTIYQVSFPGSNPNGKFEMTVTAPPNADVAEGILRFRWVDVNGLTGIETQDSVDWYFARAEKSANGAIYFSIPERSFYSFLQSNIEPAPANVTRKISKVNIIVWVGASDVNTYQKINSAQGGLTADQIKPIYTNLKGTDVYGLFSSRSMRSHLAKISDVTLDSLMNNAITKPLGFSGRSLY